LWFGPEHTPDNEGSYRCNNGDGHEISRRRIGNALNWRVAPLRLAHQQNYPRQKCVAADAIRTHDKPAGPVHRGAYHRRLFSSHRFAGHHKFVLVARAFENGAVHRNFLGRANTRTVVRTDCIEWDIFFATVFTYSLRHLGRQVAEDSNRPHLSGCGPAIPEPEPAGQGLL
jgi:hypothetical protein